MLAADLLTKNEVEGIEIQVEGIEVPAFSANDFLNPHDSY